MTSSLNTIMQLSNKELATYFFQAAELKFHDPSLQPYCYFPPGLKGQVAWNTFLSLTEDDFWAIFNTSDENSDVDTLYLCFLGEALKTESL